MNFFFDRPAINSIKNEKVKIKSAQEHYFFLISFHPIVQKLNVVQEVKKLHINYCSLLLVVTEPLLIL